MLRISIFVIVAIGSLFQLSFAQSQSSTATGPHIRVALISEYTQLIPGQSQYLAVHMQPDDDWHTYWRNPGDSGEPPSITWSSSADLQFGSIQWPLPEQIPVAHLVNYGYSRAHLLMVPITVPELLAGKDSISITGDLSWLVCKEDCVPGWATLTLSLPVSSNKNFSASAPLFSNERDHLPSPNRLSAQYESSEQHIALSTPQLDNSDWYWFPVQNAVASHSAPQQVVYESSSTHVLLKKSDYFVNRDEALSFLVSNGVKGFYVDAVPAVLSTKGLNESEITFLSIATYAGMAFIGGLILNLMPCVLPILSIKALALQSQSQSRLHKWAYLLGVAVCFNAFALFILAVKATGTELGWGFHLQSPLMVAALAFLFTFLGLVLLDVLQLGGRFSGVGNSLVNGESTLSHFFTGVLAVIVASPCTAPFMAAALGVALTQTWVETLVIFNALALGFATPLTLLFASNRARGLLPKPGQWMVAFKHGLAFPMFATVAWLCWVYAGQVGLVNQFVLLCCLVAFAFFAWLSARIKFSVIGMIASCSVLLLPYSQSNESMIRNEANISLAYSADLLAELRRNDQVVLVNMTADWCITCKVNEHVALKTQAVEEMLKEENVHYLVGDWTNKNDSIFAYLKAFQRVGVPLYVIYAGDDYVKVLPQVLTPDIVVNNLNLALQERNNDL